MGSVFAIGREIVIHLVKCFEHFLVLDGVCVGGGGSSGYSVL